jgi:hypothetical protein
MAGGSRQIFISYARGDAERVNVLVDGLRQLRYNAWVDEELTGGQAWWDTVLSQIRASAAVLIAVSPAALESVAVRREYEYAHSVRRPLLPVVVGRVRLELLPSLLGALQVVDYCEPGMKSAFDLAAALAGLPTPQALPRPLPEPPPIPISYLSGLKERSQAAALSRDEQLLLVAELKVALSRASDRAAAEEVLRSLQDRDDLYLVSAREIESLLSPMDRQQKTQQEAAQKAQEEVERKAREEAERKSTQPVLPERRHVDAPTTANPSTPPRGLRRLVGARAREGGSVFISYRRGLSELLAREVRKDLIEHGFDTFVDLENIDSGEFERVILGQIEAREHFIVLLEPGSLHQIGKDGDRLRREIAYALTHGRNVVPVTANEFEFRRDLLPPDVARLATFNAVAIPPGYFDGAMERLRTRFLKVPSNPTARP